MLSNFVVESNFLENKPIFRPTLQLPISKCTKLISSVRCELHFLKTFVFSDDGCAILKTIAVIIPTKAKTLARENSDNVLNPNSNVTMTNVFLEDGNVTMTTTVETEVTKFLVQITNVPRENSNVLQVIASKKN